MGFIKYRNNAESFQAYTPKAVDVPYQSIPFSQIEFSDIVWDTQTSDFTASNTEKYELDATSNDIDITLPAANDIDYIVFYRSDDELNTVRIIGKDISNKFLNPTSTILRVTYNAGDPVPIGTVLLVSIVGDYSSLGGGVSLNKGDIFTTTISANIPAGKLAYDTAEYKDIITDRPFYIAKYANGLYDIEYINYENYPYDRNNNSKPVFI